MTRNARKLLTDKHVAVLIFLHDYTLRNGFAPSWFEIGAFIETKSPGANAYIFALECFGLIGRVSGRPRGIYLTDKGKAMAEPVLERIRAAKQARRAQPTKQAG